MSAHRVLLVEDEGLIAADTTDRLEALGHVVVGTASTAEEAFAQAVGADIVLMDIRIDGPIDGIDAALVRVEGTDVWHRTLQLPAGSRVEYKLEVVRHGQGEWIQDPLNSNQARDPFGRNSVAHGTGYEVPEWTRPNAGVRPGRIDERLQFFRRDELFAVLG